MTLKTDEYTEEFDGDKITNQPDCTLEDTGFYHTNHYGCWHRVTVISGEHELGKTFYMIGEYPNEE